MLLVSLGLSTQVWGEESEEPEASEESFITEPSSTALQISPVSARIALESGKTTEREFNIANGGASALTVRVYAAPYTAGGEEYINDFTSQTQYTKISGWISFLDSDDEAIDEPVYTLDPGQSIAVKYRITVPEDTASGGQYACLFAETIDDSQEAEGIKTVTRAGLIVLGNVVGETRRLVKIGDIDINSILFKGKINITANVENVGNIDFQTSVDINIKSMFGKELYNDQLVYTVFPETTRKIYTEWEDTPYTDIEKFVESKKNVLSLKKIKIDEKEEKRFFKKLTDVLMSFHLLPFFTAREAKELGKINTKFYNSFVRYYERISDNLIKKYNVIMEKDYDRNTLYEQKDDKGHFIKVNFFN